MYLSSSHTISEDDERVVWNDGQLSFIGHDVEKIPNSLIRLYGPKAQKLDLSFNVITTLDGLESFSALKELILDNNCLDDSVNFSYNPNLQTLSLNKNKFIDLETILKQIANNYSNLKFLSLLGNVACPDQLSSAEKDENDYNRYRRYVLYMLPKLKFLDSTRIKNSERRDALERGQFLRVFRPNQHLLERYGEEHNMSNIFSPLPSEIKTDGTHTGAYGRLRHRYTGKHSEGNRFIRNNEL